LDAKWIEMCLYICIHTRTDMFYVTVPNQFSYSLLAMGSLGESDAITEEFYNKVKCYFLPLHLG